MAISHFDLGTLKADFEQGEEGTIVKDALLLIEGTHKDNAGKEHNFTSDRVLKIAHNTNQALNGGTEIPFMRNHSKQDGDKIGEIVSDIEVRKISTEDLPNKKQTHLLGRLGAFAKIEVRDAIDKVKNKTIKLLSPGIDPLKDVMVEISSVAFPAIPGLSLFSQHGFTSYREAKEQIEASAKLKRELQECFDVFWGVVLAVNSEEDEQPYQNNNKDALLVKAIEDFSEDLAEKLEVDLQKIYKDKDARSVNPYSSNPYGQDVVNHNIEPNLVRFEKTNKKRRKKLS